MKLPAKTFTLSIFFALCSFFSPSFSQTNLVPNPSFEDTLNCSINLGQVEAAYPWFNPTNCTPDYLTYNSACGPSPYDQAPRTGIAYVGEYMWNAFNVEGVREYFSIRLDSILLASVKYEVSFYVSRSDYFMYAIDRIGAYISVDTTGFYGGICDPLLFTPQVSNSFGSVLTDTTGWTLISGVFVANGGENFLTIGNFYSVANFTIVVDNPSGFSGAYYHFDDISVIRCDSCTVGINENYFSSRLNIFPNPLTEYSEIELISSSERITEISLFDITGKKINAMFISDNQKPNTKKIFLRNNISEGIYILNIQTTANTFTRKIIITN